MWGNEVDRRVIKPSSAVVDSPDSSWDVATANLISTHTHNIYCTFSHQHAHMCTISHLAVVSSGNLYSCDLFLFTPAVTVCTLGLLPCCLLTTSRVLLLFCVKRQDPRRFRIWKSGTEEHEGPAAHSGDDAVGWVWWSLSFQPPSPIVQQWSLTFLGQQRRTYLKEKRFHHSEHASCDPPLESYSKLPGEESWL